MSLDGIANPLLASLAPIARPQAPTTAAPRPAGDVATPAVDRAGQAARPEPTLRATPSVAAPAATPVPVEAPPGTDPALWSVLTSEERAFFARTASMGPLTYGAIKNATLPAPPTIRGGRLDVRA